ncbi:uncharacterized protein VTP21DRAFT_1989 [Calcarisporiella thermophila]|uniref:uncharacterized protein n=1 Tax=Calcarisporiella thermophila TaxID=911321 RepID=UPI003741FFBE
MPIPWIPINLREKHESVLNGESREQSPGNYASIWSTLCFQWMSPLLNTGYNHALEADDIYALPREFSSKSHYEHFKTVRGTTLLKRLIAANPETFVAQLLFSASSIILDFGAPFFLQKLLLHIERFGGEKWELSLFYILMITFAQVIRTLSITQMFYQGRTVEINFRGQLSGAIYEKVLQKKNLTVDELNTVDEEKTKADIGKVTNLLVVDVDRIVYFISYWYFMIVLPAAIIIGYVYLCILLGFMVSTLGFLTMMLAIPLNSSASKLYSRNQDHLMNARDSRISLMNELLHGIRVVKYFAWEPRFREKLLDIRQTELARLAQTYIYRGCMVLIWASSPIIVPLVVFAFYTLGEGNQLSASLVFTVIAIFERLRTPVKVLPIVIMQFFEARVSLRRIEEFIEEVELDTPQNANEEWIGIKNGNFRWHKSHLIESEEAAMNSASFQLKNITVEFPVGELSLICGPTGSGKTSLLMALLGELEAIRGNISLPQAAEPILDPVTGLFNNRVAYVSQHPWLQQATIRDNILFGDPFDENRYRRVLWGCALIRDLEMFEQGDLTEVGEKGVILSGGQKQRIALARAIYSRARHLLFDDCLSAVDSHTARHIYTHCLTGSLMNGRTRILITHNIRLCLPAAKLLVVLRNGEIENQGTIRNLNERGVLKRILTLEEENGDNGDPVNEVQMSGISQQEDKEIELLYINGLDSKRAKKQSNNGSSTLVEESRIPVDFKLIREEHRERGRVSTKIYAFYFSAAGGVFFITILLAIFILERTSNMGESWWLKIWTSAYEKPKQLLHNHIIPNYKRDGALNTTGFFTHSVDVRYYLLIYAIICLCTILCIFLGMVTQCMGSLRASQVLHEKLLDAILGAPIRFFDQTPVGRVLNRFSKDMATIDSSLIINLSEMFANLFAIFGAIIAIVVIMPWLIVSAVFITYIYIVMGRKYLATSRELKRLDSVSRSPIYSHFNETIFGATTIRAFGVQNRFKDKCFALLDTNMKYYYYLWAANRWLSVRADSLGAVFSGLTGVFLLYKVINGELDAGAMGLALTFAQSFTGQINFSIRWYTDLEMGMNTVERVREYVDIPRECMGSGVLPPAAWPTKGEIEVRNLYISYAPELEPVLRGISFSIKAGEKIGIVGRTGSGKSTLVNSLLRFVNPLSGSILIDGLDITSIDLHHLRSRLTIIPQDPVLFSGTVRSNLDPFSEYDDMAIWTVLRRVQLISSQSVSATTESQAISSLEMFVSEGGLNFSQGQRALLCLARALLRNSKIVIMDEATASIDFEADSRIQSTLREELGDAVVICIAHRLQTVADYDKILVMDEGLVKEFDSPLKLLSDDNSMFYSLCQQTGELELLLEMARGHKSK